MLTPEHDQGAEKQTNRDLAQLGVDLVHLVAQELILWNKALVLFVEEKKLLEHCLRVEAQVLP